MEERSGERRSPPIELEPKPFIDLVRETFPILRANPALCLAGPALFSYLPMVIVGVPVCAVALVIGLIAGFQNKALIFPSMLPVGFIGVIAYAMLCNRIRVVWTKMVLNLLRGEHANLADFKKPAPEFMNFFLCMLLSGLATATGGILFVIPGIFIAVRLAFAPFIIAEQNTGPVEAIRMSNDLVKGYSWQVLACISLLWLSCSVAGLIPIPGAQLLALPFLYAYHDLVLGQIYIWQTSDN